MYEGDPQNEHDKWTVDASLVGRRPGAGEVQVRLVNAVLGALPPVDVWVDWKAGMEEADVVVLALGLVGQSAGFLSTACIKAAAERSVRGE